MIEDEKLREPTVHKLVVVGEDEKVVGVHLIGPGSDEITQGLAVAIKMGGTVIYAFIHVYYLRCANDIFT